MRNFQVTQGEATKNSIISLLQSPTGHTPGNSDLSPDQPLAAETTLARQLRCDTGYSNGTTGMSLAQASYEAAFKIER